MGNDREVEMNKGKTFNTFSGGKAWQKKQRNCPESLRKQWCQLDTLQERSLLGPKPESLKLGTGEGHLLPSVNWAINFQKIFFFSDPWELVSD